jgi:hypothetical protein
MIYTKIFFATAFLYCLKHKLKFGVALILIIIINILLIDSEQNYKNIHNINNKIINELNGQYISHEENFIIKSKDKKRFTVFVNESINKHLSFKNLEKYTISYENKERIIFEIDFLNPNNDIFIKNIYESYLNNVKKYDYSFLEKKYFINYLNYNNDKNYTLNDVFYNVLLIISNTNSNKSIKELINYLNTDNIYCDSYDILINKNSQNTRLSVLCD